MQITIELESEKPLYMQIRDQVIEGLANGSLQNGESLPSTRRFAMDFAINFHTVNKAYDMLRQEGVLRLNRKTGAVVSVSHASADVLEEWGSRLRTLLAEAFIKGMDKQALTQHCIDVITSFDEQGECSQ